MTFQPKRPSSGGFPATRPPNSSGPTTSVRPGTVREAMTEAAALGGSPISRPSMSATRGPVRKTILLVDPDAGLRARLRALLEADYDVLEAKDGMEAVEMTSTVQPSMVVADTVMPRLDGFTLAKILRNNPLMKRVPIMFVSSQHSPQHVTQALVIGVSQYLPKSTPVTQIAEKIRKIVL